MEKTILTKINNDNKWLDEWIQHHLSIGFTKIVIFDNNIGQIDYPMSDYVILMCMDKKVKMINKRNTDIAVENYINEYVNGTDYVIRLSVDEYIHTTKDTIDDVIGNDSLSLRVYPYHLKNGKELIMDKYFAYGKRTLYHGNKIEETNDMYIEKFPNRTETEWKKYINGFLNERS